ASGSMARRRPAEDKEQTDNDGLAALHPSPRTRSRIAHALSRTPEAGCYIRTPRPTCSRVTAISGRSPGLRVIAGDRLPRAFRLQWLIGRKLTAHSCGGSRGFTAFPFDSLRDPLSAS